MTYIPKPVKITRVIKDTKDIYTFRVKTSMKHDPGQFIQVSVLGYGEAPISLASYNPKFLELNIRAVGNVTNELLKLKRGDTMLIRGPYGNGYNMDWFKGNDIIVVGGGTGVAPVRGFIKYLEAHRKDFGQVDLFFGFRTPDDMLFKQDYKNWSKVFNLHLTVDKKEDKHKNYKGQVGLVTKVLAESGLTNHKKMVACCGPPIMIKFTIQTLKQMGFNDDQIFLSEERHMKCAVGKCGHCMIHGKYDCKQGPVFRYDKIKDAKD